MDIRPIRTNRNHRAALAEIEQLWGAPEGSDDGDRLDMLVTLVEAYEDRRWPLATTDPIKSPNVDHSASHGSVARVVIGRRHASDWRSRAPSRT